MLRPQLFVLGLVALTAIGSAQAQDPDTELNAHRERVRQREAARLQEEWKGLPAAEIERRQQIESLLKSSLRRIGGKQSPELVPHHIRMQQFFHGYEQGTYASMLAPELSSTDQALLKEFARAHRAELQKAVKLYEDDWLAIAAVAEKMSALEIATAVKAATDRSDARLTTLYRNAVGRLSPAGQGRVNEFAFLNVRPQVTVEDHFVVANADPEFYKEQVVETYKMIRAGVRPAVPRSGTKSNGTAVTESTATGQLGRSPP